MSTEVTTSPEYWEPRLRPIQQRHSRQVLNPDGRALFHLGRRTDIPGAARTMAARDACSASIGSAGHYLLLGKAHFRLGALPTWSLGLQGSQRLACRREDDRRFRCGDLLVTVRPEAARRYRLLAGGHPPRIPPPRRTAHDLRVKITAKKGAVPCADFFPALALGLLWPSTLILGASIRSTTLPPCSTIWIHAIRELPPMEIHRQNSDRTLRLFAVSDISPRTVDDAATAQLIVGTKVCVPVHPEVCSTAKLCRHAYGG